MFGNEERNQPRSTMATLGGAVAKPSEISEESSRLNNHTITLTEMVDKVYEKLTPILRVNPEIDGREIAKNVTPDTLIGRAFRDNDDRVMYAINALGRILSNVEL